MSFELPFKLPTGWQVATVDELVKQKIIAKPLDGNHGGIHPKASDYIESGVPFVMASDLAGGRVDLIDCKFISEEQASGLRKGIAKAGDVLLSHKATIGRTAIVQDSKHDFIMLTPQVTYYRVINSSALSNIYLKAYFDSRFFQSILGLWAGAGSTRAYLGITGQLKLPIILPPIEIQNEISGQVHALNKKVNLNNEINQTLEEMAQTIFKSWFVDFDPVKAKMNGDQPEGMDAATASLFPEKLVESELGLIPEGWEVTTLKALSEKISKGTTPSKKDLAAAEDDASIRFIKVKDINDQGEILRDSLEVIPNSIHVGKLKRSVLESNDILFSIAGTIGRVATVDYDLDNVNTNQAVAFIRLKDKERFLPLVYMALRENRLQKKALASIVQGVQANLSLANVGDMEVVVPSDAVLDLWNKQYSSIFKMIKGNFAQSRQLSSLRDTLLPKLLSGEIELGTSEELVEAI